VKWDRSKVTKVHGACMVPSFYALEKHTTTESLHKAWPGQSVTVRAPASAPQSLKKDLCHQTATANKEEVRGLVGWWHSEQIMMGDCAEL
jgi:hypothetical protein